MPHAQLCRQAGTRQHRCLAPGLPTSAFRLAALQDDDRVVFILPRRQRLPGWIPEHGRQHCHKTDSLQGPGTNGPNIDPVPTLQCFIQGHCHSVQRPPNQGSPGCGLLPQVLHGAQLPLRLVLMQELLHYSSAPACSHQSGPRSAQQAADLPPRGRWQYAVHLYMASSLTNAFGWHHHVIQTCCSQQSAHLPEPTHNLRPYESFRLICIIRQWVLLLAGMHPYELAHIGCTVGDIRLQREASDRVRRTTNVARETAETRGASCCPPSAIAGSSTSAPGQHACDAAEAAAPVA